MKREQTPLEKKGLPSMYGALLDLEDENRKIRKKLREAKAMIKSLEETLASLLPQDRKAHK